ncbi:MAG TPA: hypothetical protein VFS19_06370, partial [Planctomycetota bacterium]|nr:hypothetical protein [Planctomycetota bacterium]
SRINNFVNSTLLAAADQDARIKFYHKTKHGKLIVSSGAVLDPKAGDIGPFAFYVEKGKVKPLGLPETKAQAKITFNKCIRIAHAIGDLIVFYLLTEGRVTYSVLVQTIEKRWKVINLNPV